MPKEVISEGCPLCGRKAQWVTGNYGNCRDYHCANDGCGDHRISKQAMSIVTNDSALRSQAKSTANSLSGTGKVLFIMVDSSKKFKMDPIEKASIRFFKC